MMVMTLAVVAMSANEAAKGDGAKSIDRAVACRRIAEPAERLACYDGVIAALEEDVRSRKVVVLDQEQVVRTRRSLFGLSLPTAAVFGGRGGDKQAELRQIGTVVTTASRDREGRIVFAVQDGARWLQDDDRTLMLARIKPGTKVRISRASLGTYFANFEGGGSAKVRRDR